jgi:hypothetical protein
VKPLAGIFAVLLTAGFALAQSPAFDVAFIKLQPWTGKARSLPAFSFAATL